MTSTEVVRYPSLIPPLGTKRFRHRRDTTLVFAPSVCQASQRARARQVERGRGPYADRVLAPMDRYGDYLVTGVVGHGGSATVYRAHRPSSPEVTVALKVLDEQHHDPVHLDRLQREFDFANDLKHPRIVTTFECGPGWLAMELMSRWYERRRAAVATVDGRAAAVQAARVP